MNTSAQAHIKMELLNYGTLTQIPVIKLFCLFTSLHTTKPSNYFINYIKIIIISKIYYSFIFFIIVPNVQYNLQTGAIACQFGPSMINSLTAAIELWKNNSYFITTPFIICNDTNFQIM